MRAALCMPDGHWGYGFPIGGVAAFRADTGVISPGSIGFDIVLNLRTGDGSTALPRAGKTIASGVDMELKPHTVLPVQFHAPRAPSPEKRLMLAVLEDALGIYKRYAHVAGRRRWRLVAETEQWLFSDDTGWPLSFVNVCHALGIDVAWLREQLCRNSGAETLAAAPIEAGTWGARSGS